MYHYILNVNNREIMNMAKRAFDLVDARLIGHGERVSRIMYRLLKIEAAYSPLEMRNLLILAAFHDIGAYKMEEIDRMLEFETKNVWNHSIYGYLFFHYFSFLKDMALAVLFHHTPWSTVRDAEEVPERMKRAAQLLHLADRADIYFENSQLNKCSEDFIAVLEQKEESEFSKEVIALARQTELFLGKGNEEEERLEYEQAIEAVPFTQNEREDLLKMLTYAIDFRSPHTVTHTITTTIISLELANRLCNHPEDVRNVFAGAMLHDLGKIGIPVEILEFPGKLSPQAMKVMKSHVALTQHILGGSVSDTVREIALRHHEKLDGSGYPRGLSAKDLDMPQRIVAVADIISALTGTRSYKEAFSKEKTTAIIRDMADKGFLDSSVTALAIEELDGIMKSVKEQADPILHVYREMQNRYAEISAQAAEKDRIHNFCL